MATTTDDRNVRNKNHLERVIATMAEKETVKDWKDVEIFRSDIPQITLPKDMTYKQARDWLARKELEETKEVTYYEEITGPYPTDSLVAFAKAVKEVYGWHDLVPTPGFFGPTPPAMISIATGPHDTVQVPYGSLQLPTVDGRLETQIKIQKGIKPSFILTGIVFQRSVPKLKELARKTRQILATDSIYKSKAIRVNWNWEREGRKFDLGQDIPSFMSLGNLNESELIFSDNVKRQLKIGLFTALEHTKSFRDHKIPLKRGVLLEGPYGTGKSLTALVTAKKATDNGWTYIYLDNVLDLKSALELAWHYEPSVVFAEDVDQIMGTEERDEQVNGLLNCIDGIEAKKHEVITVLTTNHIEKLSRAFIRPGRMDTIVSVTPPDSKAAAGLVQLYGRGMFSEKADFNAIGDRLAGKIPAVIREIVERAKIATIARVEGKDSVMGRVNEEDIADAATAIENHEIMIKQEKPAERYLEMSELTVKLPAWDQLNGN